MTIIGNRTNHADADIIAAVEAAVRRGEDAVGDNNSHAGDGSCEPWERVDYSMRVEVGGDPLVVVWHMTERGWRYAETHDGDESEACNWDEIDEVRHG